MMSDWKDRNAIVYRDVELDVRWDSVTDRIILYDTLGDELIIMQSKTLDEIGEEFNLTKERVRQLNEKTLKKMRSNALIKNISFA